MISYHICIFSVFKSDKSDNIIHCKRIFEHLHLLGRKPVTADEQLRAFFFTEKTKPLYGVTDDRLILQMIRLQMHRKGIRSLIRPCKALQKQHHKKYKPRSRKNDHKSTH